MGATGGGVLTRLSSIKCKLALQRLRSTHREVEIGSVHTAKHQGNTCGSYLFMACKALYEAVVCLQVDTTHFANLSIMQ
eukprot:10625-Heterococcus_DN1.PRE.5